MGAAPALKRAAGAPPPPLKRAAGAPAPPPTATPPLPPLKFWAELVVEAAIGRTSAIAATVLKTFNLIIVGLHLRGYWLTSFEGGRSRASHRLCAQQH